eukprot:152180-Prymnesium_polylepis.1
MASSSVGRHKAVAEYAHARRTRPSRTPRRRRRVGAKADPRPRSSRPTQGERHVSYVIRAVHPSLVPRRG